MGAWVELKCIVHRGPTQEIHQRTPVQRSHPGSATNFCTVVEHRAHASDKQIGRHRCPKASMFHPRCLGPFQEGSYQWEPLQKPYIHGVSSETTTRKSSNYPPEGFLADEQACMSQARTAALAMRGNGFGAYPAIDAAHLYPPVGLHVRDT